MKQRFVWLGASLLLGLSAPAEIVFDNTLRYQNSYYPPYPGAIEYGDQVNLAGTARRITALQFEYFGGFVSAGTETVKVRFYANDGLPGEAGVPGTEVPQTLLFASGDLPVFPGFNVLTLQGLEVPVPKTFTWTVQFSGLTGRYENQAGLVFYDAPILGSSYNDFWQKTPEGWQLFTFGGFLPANFAVRIFAGPEPSVAIAAAPLPDGRQKLILTGPTCQTVVLGVSNDLEHWTTVRRFFLLGQPVEFVDTPAASAKMRFYRVTVASEPLLTVESRQVDDQRNFSLHVTGLPGRSFRIEGSTDLNWWFNLHENTLVSPGFDFTDTYSHLFKSRRFYRCQYLPDLPLALNPPTVLANGRLQLLVGGPPGRDSRLLVSTDLSHWTEADTRVFSFTDGTFTFIDPPNPGSPHRFYRLQLLPLP